MLRDSAPAPKPPPTYEQVIVNTWKNLHNKILAMAKDTEYPDAKLGWKPHPDSRSVLEELRHVTIGLEMTTAVAKGEFKTLVALVKKAGLARTLSAPGHLTVFAPTDRAFANLKRSDPALYNKVATNKKLLKSVLTYHVVGKRIPAAGAIAAAKKGLKVKTVQGESIGLSYKGGKIVLNGTARVVMPDVKASNGVVHAIDAVIVPPSLSQSPAPTQSIVQIASGNPEFSTLVSLVQKAGLVEAISAPVPTRR